MLFPTYDEVIRTVQPDEQAWENLRSDLRRQRSRANRRLVILSLALATIFLVSAVAVVAFNQGWGLIGILSLLIGGVVWFVWLVRAILHLRSDRREIRAAFETDLLSPFTQGLGRLVFQSNPDVPAGDVKYEGVEAFSQSKLLKDCPIFDIGYQSAYGRHTIIGRIGATESLFSEIKLTKTTYDIDTGDSIVTLFKGVLLTANFSRGSGGVTILRPRAPFSGLKKVTEVADADKRRIKLRKIRTQNYDFNRAYTIRTSDEQSALELLSEDWMYWLLEFRSRYGKRVTAAFVDSRMTIAIRAYRTRFVYKHRESAEWNLRSAYDGLVFALELMLRSRID